VRAIVGRGQSAGRAEGQWLIVPFILIVVAGWSCRRSYPSLAGRAVGRCRRRWLVVPWV
jgi:hypothetical protein